MTGPLRSRIRLFADTNAEILRMLNQARDEIRATLAGQPTDYQRWQLPQLQREIEQALGSFGAAASATLGSAAGAAWEAGTGLVDRSLETGGIRIAAQLPHIDTRQLQAMRVFMTDRIKDVGARAVNKINTELGLVVIGAQAPGEAIGKISEILGDPSRRRATTIVRTELGRAYAVAAQERLSQAAKVVPGMQKRWRKSGKLHPRPGHVAADGQVVAADKPFSIITKEGEIIAMMHPHDPKAPPGETINCGCVALPVVPGWKSKVTTPEENARELADYRAKRARGDTELQRRLARSQGGPEPSALSAPGLRLGLDRAERELGDLPIERIALLDDRGNTLFTLDGNVDSVEIPPHLLPLLWGNVVTHNHVGIGSFSPDDVLMAAFHEVAELRLVDLWYRYSLKPPADGWSVRFWDEVLKPSARRNLAEVEAQWSAAAREGIISQEAMDANAMDEVWRRVSQETGVRYRRLPRKKGQ